MNVIYNLEYRSNSLVFNLQVIPITENKVNKLYSREQDNPSSSILKIFVQLKSSRLVGDLIIKI